MTLPDPDLHDADRVRLFLQLAVHSHLNVEVDDPNDYWYRLGNRNAYAAAAALLVSPLDPDAALVIADRVTTALGEGVLEVGQLERIARDPLQVGAPAVTLNWIGASAFHRAHSGKGLDLDLGMRWGERENIRISLRRIPGDTVGLLYAYDWIWDECAVLAETISVAAAEYAFHKALSLDPRMSPESFATLLPSAIEATKEPANHVPTLEISR